MIVAGIGCRKGTSSAEIEAAVDAALAVCGLARTRLDALATHASKQDEPGLRALADSLQLRLLAFTAEEMARHAPNVETVSQRVVELMGVPSVAEASALAGAGRGARLLTARISHEGATCAIAEGEGEAQP